MRRSILSAAELLKWLVEQERDKMIVPHVVVGPASHTQQQEGCVSIVDAGHSREERAGLMWPRVQLRVIASTLEHADRIARHLYAQLNDRGRTVARQESTSEDYLIHSMTVSGGPSMHIDSSETWEELLFITAMIGTDPVPGP